MSIRLFWEVDSICGNLNRFKIWQLPTSPGLWVSYNVQPDECRGFSEATGQTDQPQPIHSVFSQAVDQIAVLKKVGGMMTVRLGVILLRTSLVGWLGAAILFVAVGIREVTDPRLDSTTRDILVSVRFPLFYAVGLTLLTIATLAACLARPAWWWRRTALIGLPALALLLMVVDYVTVYGPLLELVSPPGQPRTALFQRYHSLSTVINTTGLGIVLTAAVLSQWPCRHASSVAD